MGQLVEPVGLCRGMRQARAGLFRPRTGLYIHSREVLAFRVLRARPSWQTWRARSFWGWSSTPAAQAAIGVACRFSRKARARGFRAALLAHASSSARG